MSATWVAGPPPGRKAVRNQDHDSIIDASERRVLAEVLPFDPRKKKVN
jgi:hypothetical protein